MENTPITFEDEIDEFDSEYEKQVNELNNKFRIIVEKIAYLVAEEGLSIEEACMVRNVAYDWFQDKIDTMPIVARIMQKKEFEYKRELLKPLNAAVKKGNDKLALWLLEWRYPEEFGKRKLHGGDDNDVLAAAMSFIQDTNDNGLVNRSSGKAVVIRRGAVDADGTIKKITDLLS